MYSALSIANFFIEKHLNDKHPHIDPLKLQKLVYIGFGWCWAYLTEEIFTDRIEAWKHGPVVPAVYYTFRDQGYNIKDQASYVRTPYINPEPLEENIQDILEWVDKEYGNVDSRTVSLLTHERGTPWDLSYDGSPNKEIPKDMIKDYYAGFYEQLKKKRETKAE